MGLHVYTYRNELGDCTNGGESSYAKGFYCCERKRSHLNPVISIRQMLVKQKFGFGCSLKLVPESKIDNNMTMFGGNYASTSDSRFGEGCREIMGEDIGNVYSLGLLFQFMIGLSDANGKRFIKKSLGIRKGNS